MIDQSQPEGQPHSESIGSLVLCGGAGSRMGGEDKPLIEWRGEPLVAHVLRTLPHGPVLISANRNHERYARFGWPVIPDRTSGLGPLGGIHSAQHDVATDWLYVVAGDTPCLPTDLAALLFNACKEHSAKAATARAGRIHPLPLLVQTSELKALDAYLAGGQRAVLGWLETLAQTTLDQSHRATAFVNVNTAAQLQALDT